MTVVPEATLFRNDAQRQKCGSYVLYLELRRPLTLRVGALGSWRFPSGRYAYIGSACSGIDQRVARHRRLALMKKGKPHWHIDYLLVQPEVRLEGEKPLEGSSECAISHTIASGKGVTAPVPGFGATDCRAGCEAHLYRVADSAQPKAGICKEKRSWTKLQSNSTVKEKRDS